MSGEGKKKKKQQESDDESQLIASKGEQEITPDPENFDIKHPLQHSWTIWYNGPQSKHSRNLREWKPKSVYTLGTVEEFWCLYNSLVPPSQLNNGSNYHFFKEGIEPSWEDKHNASGGKWTIPFEKKGEAWDNSWLYMLLAMIGEDFEDSDEICGCVFSPRSQNTRMALWTKTASSEAAQRRIGNAIKKTLNVRTITYQRHTPEQELYTV
jgi:translation initiation factor 4E